MLQTIIAYLMVAGAFVAMVWMLFLSPQTKWNIKRRLRGQKPFVTDNCGGGCGCETQTVHIRAHQPKTNDKKV